jgi:hypothetical protein
MHLVRVAYAELLHTSSVEDWPEGHDGWGCGTLARLDFFLSCSGMRQSLVAPRMMCTRRNAEARHASDLPRARAGVAGLLDAFVLGSRAG